MVRRLAILTAAAALIMTPPVYAGQWMEDGNGCWWQNDDGSYPFLTWAWVDGNHDGIAENYCFDGNGYLSLNPADQGVRVNGDGAALYNGMVCMTVLPEGWDYYPGMAIHGERADWAYDGAWADGLESQLEENRTAVSNQANPLEDLDPYGLAYVIWELVNEERESRGRNALDMNDELMENAMVRAEEVNRTFSHTRPDGRYYNTVITATHSSSGENLAGRGYLNAHTVHDFAKKVVDGWLNSSGHKKNMLDSKWKETGVGVYITEYGYDVSQLYIK